MQQHNLWEILQKNASEKEIVWLTSKSTLPNKGIQTAFVATPRFISRKPLVAENTPFETWTLDRLARVYLLMCLDSSDEIAYVDLLETLFDTAEMNEAVALYVALPYLAYPDQWLLRATDAVRSNVGIIFDAIAFHNPFPKTHFNELAWNQLVLKCIFNDKPILLIDGLEERSNQALADTLSDFAHERWAAGRTVPAEVWQLVKGFVTETILEDLKLLLQSNRQEDREVATLLIHNS